MKFWQSLIYAPADELLDLARAAEAAGFEGVGLPDHVTLPERMTTPYPYMDVTLDPMGPYLDCVASISAMAAVTSRLRFTTYVYVLPMRNPFVVAKGFGTASILSQGRVALGVGVGWLGEEFALLDQEFRTRGARTDEMLAILEDLWTTGRTEHRGRYYQPEATCMAPVPEHPIPVWIGGHSVAAFARAARHDGWIGLNFDLDAAAELLARLQAARRAQADATGIPPADDYEVMLAPTEPIDRDLCRRLSDLGVTSVLTPILVAQGARTPQERLDTLRRFGDEVIASQ